MLRREKSTVPAIAAITESFPCHAVDGTALGLLVFSIFASVSFIFTHRPRHCRSNLTRNTVPSRSVRPLLPSANETLNFLNRFEAVSINADGQGSMNRLN